MIQHEITILKDNPFWIYCLITLDRDILHHREGGSPSKRSWNSNGIIFKEEYRVRGVLHSVFEKQPAYKEWDSDGVLRVKTHYLNGQIWKSVRENSN
jgi:hypothetical protein